MGGRALRGWGLGREVWGDKDIVSPCFFVLTDGSHCARNNYNAIVGLVLVAPSTALLLTFDVAECPLVLIPIRQTTGVDLVPSKTLSTSSIVQLQRFV